MSVHLIAIGVCMLEPELLKLANLYPINIITLFEKAQSHYKYFGRFETTRILIELGKQNFTSVSALFERALQSDNLSLKVTSIYELTELVNNHPQHVVKLIDKVLNSNYGDLYFKDNNLLSILLARDPCIIVPLLEQALHSEISNVQWLALLAIIELAIKCPDTIIPLLEQALHIDEPRIQWMSSLKLFDMFKTHPKQIAPIFKKVMSGYTSDINTNSVMVNMLTELGKQNLNLIISLLKHSLKSDDIELEWAAVLSLIDLVKLSPEKLIPLLGIAAQSKHSHVQWLANITLVQLHKVYPQLVGPLLVDNLPAITDARGSNKKSSSLLYALRKQDPTPLIALYEKVIYGDDLCLKWLAVLELILLADNYTDQVKTILQKFWRLDKKAKQFKSARVLVELGNKDPVKVAPYFDQALQSANYDLQWAAVLELIAVIRNHPRKLFAVLEKIRQEKPANVIHITS